MNIRKKDNIKEKLIEYWYTSNKELYKETLANLSIYVYVNQNFNIKFRLEYSLKNVVYSYNTGRNYFSFQSDVNLVWTKKEIEKVKVLIIFILNI